MPPDDSGQQQVVPSCVTASMPWGQTEAFDSWELYMGFHALVRTWPQDSESLESLEQVCVTALTPDSGSEYLIAHSNCPTAFFYHHRQDQLKSAQGHLHWQLSCCCWSCFAATFDILALATLQVWKLWSTWHYSALSSLQLSADAMGLVSCNWYKSTNIPIHGWGPSWLLLPQYCSCQWLPLLPQPLASIALALTTWSLPPVLLALLTFSLCYQLSYSMNDENQKYAAENHYLDLHGNMKEQHGRVALSCSQSELSSLLIQPGRGVWQSVCTNCVIL
jgi:hypothetical protein